MKKIWFLFLLFICGCSNKDVLECSISNDVDLYNNSIVFKFNEDNIVINEEFIIKEDFKDLFDINTLFDSVFNSYSLLDGGGIKVDSNKKDSSFNVIITIDKSIIDDNTKGSITNLFGIDTSKDNNEIKSSLEKNGYICK